MNSVDAAVALPKMLIVSSNSIGRCHGKKRRTIAIRGAQTTGLVQACNHTEIVFTFFTPLLRSRSISSNASVIGETVTAPAAKAIAAEAAAVGP